MILAIRTDSPQATLCLLNSDGAELQTEHWQADRRLARELLGKIENLLKKQNANWTNLTGLVVYRGPGSFTGLRIAITVMNTIAYSQDIPIVGVSGDSWLADGARSLSAGKNDRVVLPEYGADARITNPRK